MKTRILLVALLSVSAAPAFAGDRDPSPFYRKIFAADTRPVPEKRTENGARREQRMPPARPDLADGR